jgi:hypothetical protein
MLRDTSAASTSKRSTSAARAACGNKASPIRTKVRIDRRKLAAASMLPIMLTNLGKSSTAGQRIALGGNETVGRKRDLH